MQADLFIWADSEVLIIQPPAAPGNEARVVLSAARVDRHPSGLAGAPRQGDVLAGYLRPLTFVIEGARLHGTLTDCLGGVCEGTVDVALGRPAKALPLPWQTHEPLSLHLRFRNGSMLRIDGQAAHCRPGPDARFAESYAC